MGPDSRDGHGFRGAEPDSADRLRRRERARHLRPRASGEERRVDQLDRVAVGVPAGDEIHVLEDRLLPSSTSWLSATATRPPRRTPDSAPRPQTPAAALHPNPRPSRAGT